MYFQRKLWILWAYCFSLSDSLICYIWFLAYFGNFAAKFLQKTSLSPNRNYHKLSKAWTAMEFQWIDTRIFETHILILDFITIKSEKLIFIIHISKYPTFQKFYLRKYEETLTSEVWWGFLWFFKWNFSTSVRGDMSPGKLVDWSINVRNILSNTASSLKSRCNPLFIISNIKIRGKIPLWMSIMLSMTLDQRRSKVYQS